MKQCDGHGIRHSKNPAQTFKLTHWRYIQEKIYSREFSQSAAGSHTTKQPEAVLRGGRQGGRGRHPSVRTVLPCVPSNETGCKVVRLHNNCIYSVASHSWCQITPFTQWCIMSSWILAPPIQIWPPQTATARNAPGDSSQNNRWLELNNRPDIGNKTPVKKIKK